jgi:hypothetical protein
MAYFTSRQVCLNDQRIAYVSHFRTDNSQISLLSAINKAFSEEIELSEIKEN